MSTDMAGLQMVISQAHKKAGLESIGLISQFGLPVASVGVSLDLGVIATTVFSIFSRAGSELQLGETEHIAIIGKNKQFIVKPLRTEKGKLHSWFVALAPAFGGQGLLDLTESDKSTIVSHTGIESKKDMPSGLSDSNLISTTIALWSTIDMLGTNVNLGEVLGLYLDGDDGRVVIQIANSKWLVSFPSKERRVGKIDVELDKAAIMLKTLL
jgi:predicted regulator of Ras-like GTPase activity (Roadblock/LC7/MglB family)